jgi:hypothetical protein
MHENTKAGLLRAETFIDEYGDGLPALNVEVHHGGTEIHIHPTTAGELRQTHLGLGSPKWTVGLTDTNAAVSVGDVTVHVYYSSLRDEPDAQATLREAGLVSGLALVKGA